MTDKSKIFSHPAYLVFGALLCCALWGSATPMIKKGYEFCLPDKDVPSTILFAGLRFFFAGVITVIIYSIARRKILYPAPKNLGKVGIVSLFQTIIQYVFFYVGLSNTTGVKGTVCSGSSVFMAIIVSCLIFKQEKLTVKKIVACLLGFGGILLINLNGLDFNMNFTGDVFVLFSAASLGISSVLIKKFSSSEDPVVISGYQFIIDILYLGNGLQYAHTLGREACQNIGLRVIGKCHEGINLIDPLLLEQFVIASVTMDNHHMIIYHIGEPMATVNVILENLYMHGITH